MNLIEQIQIGEELIRKCKSQGKKFKSLETNVQGLKKTLHRDIERMKLSELKDRDMAIQIYSEVLCCNLWLCSNNGMAAKIRGDDPEAVTYTVGELREIINLKPNPEDLKAIHNAKLVFPNSKIIDSKLNNKNEEKEN